MIRFPTLLLIFVIETSCILPFALLLQGRYTTGIDEYDLVVPRKLTGDGRFLTWSLAHHFPHEHDAEMRRRKRKDAPAVSYGIAVGGKDHHVDLWPNHQLLSPSAIVETRAATLRDSKLRRVQRNLCHYVGKVRGVHPSSVAISTCDGLAGYVKLNGKRYFIEPLNEHAPNKRGQHLHVVYPEYAHIGGPRCGVNENWTDAWRHRLLDKEMERMKRLHDGEDDDVELTKRGEQSVERYAESMVVVDKKFIEHHKNTDMEQYILTMMNMVSEYYHDASIGNQLEFVVVRIMYLEKEEEEMDLEISQNGEKTLRSFCDWQKTVNPKDTSNPNHHDVAVLISRHDLCSDNVTECGLMGLAYLAGACKTEDQCAINEDAGLISAMVVAHEIGHLLGASHDTEEISGCKPQAEDKSYFVMSPYVHMDMNIWSPCTRTYVTTFFDSDLGECMNDKPEVSLYPDNHMMAGAVYDGTAQCQMEFPGSTVCITKPDIFCGQLRCRTEPDLCVSKGEPPADGTKCGENMWCYDMKCVEIGERPNAVNGGWGSWGSYGDCSRSCGAGVQISERDCNNPPPTHKGRYCLGERKRTKICNTHPCPEGKPGFRAAQCTAFNEKPFQEKLWTWVPHKVEDAPCSLYCSNEGHVFVKLEPRAKDGTPCKPGTRDMCISGVCRKVGCDYVVDSDAVEDDCGVCKGDGTECKIVDKVFNGTGKGYVKVAVIYKGAHNIVFEELKPSKNTLAVSGPDEKTFSLNGNKLEMRDGEIPMGGTEGLYEHTEPLQEMLVIHGPIKENIVLFVVFYEALNPGYHYKYAEASTKSNYQPTYNWEFIDWDECDRHCGGGIQKSEPKCVDTKVGLVTSSFCQQADKPEVKTRKCNERACLKKWRMGKWGKCIACQNISGMRMREVDCVREAAHRGADDVLLEDSECTEKKPGMKELCNSEKKCRQNPGIESEASDEHLPASMMRRVWLQTVPQIHDADIQLPMLLADIRNLNKKTRDVRKLNRKRAEDFSVCEPSTPACKPTSTCKPSKKVEIKVGEIVKDPVDTENFKLIETPFKPMGNEFNLTDEGYETLGDKLTDLLDEAHEKVYTKEEAAKRLAKLEHQNATLTR